MRPRTSLLLGALLALTAGSCAREMTATECNLVEVFRSEVCLRCDGDGACVEMGSNRCVEQCSPSRACTYTEFPVCGPEGLCVPLDCPSRSVTPLPDAGTPDQPVDMAVVDQGGGEDLQSPPDAPAPDMQSKPDASKPDMADVQSMPDAMTAD